MFDKIRKHTKQFFVFTTHLLLMVVLIFVLKEIDDKNKPTVLTEENTDLTPIDQKVLDTQNQIALDRDNKLRKLNNSPKEIKQEQVTTNTITETANANRNQNANKNGNSNKNSNVNSNKNSNSSAKKSQPKADRTTRTS